MAIRKEHELHSRRKGRNVGVGVLLAAFVVLVLVLTMVKVTSSSFNFPDNLSSGAEAQD